MTPEPDFLKPPAYEVNTENFLSDLSTIQKRFPDLRIFGRNITKDERIDTFYTLAVEAGNTKLGQLFWNIVRSAEIESATMNAVSVWVSGRRKRTESAEKEIDDLTLRHEGTRIDREFNAYFNRTMDKMYQGKPLTAKILVYEFSDQQS